MDQYSLGKDIQQILSRLEHLENAVGYSKGCGCSSKEMVVLNKQDLGTEEEAELVWEGERPLFLDDGKVELLPSKSFTFAAGRLCRDYCNWRRQETVTIWSNGRYENITEIRCEHGWLYTCYFRVTMTYKDSSGAGITTTGWDKRLGGTEVSAIRDIGYNEAIKLSYDRITKVTRSRYARC